VCSSDLGFVTGFRNNRFYPERELTYEEASLLIKAPNARVKGVEINRKNVLRPRELSAMAEEVFRHVLGSPKSGKRGDVAVWLESIAELNGFFDRETEQR
jgi:hypothetical protein